MLITDYSFVLLEVTCCPRGLAVHVQFCGTKKYLILQKNIAASPDPRVCVWGGGGERERVGNSLYAVWYKRSAGIASIF